MSSPTAEGGRPVPDSPSLNPDDLARRRASIALWRNRSAVVARLRKALPIAIGLIVLILVGFVAVNSILRFAAFDGSKNLSIRMLNPKFYGRMPNGRPYLLSAVSATRDEADPSRIDLAGPLMILGDPAIGPATRVQAAQGVFREDDQILRLTGQVLLDDGAGFVFHTDRAAVDTAKGLVNGESPVTGQGPLGRISASSYAISDEGRRVAFHGRVRARIEQPRRGR